VRGGCESALLLFSCSVASGWYHDIGRASSEERGRGNRNHCLVLAERNAWSTKYSADDERKYTDCAW
jgi:hypothetical protein